MCDLNCLQQGHSFLDCNERGLTNSSISFWGPSKEEN